MISSGTVLAFAISMLCTLVLPVVALVILLIKKKVNPLPLTLGFASFFISQMILRIPLLQLTGGMAWMQALMQNMVLYMILIGGLSAGLFEETARLVGASLLKRNRTYKDMISFGLGHGLCEVILLIGFGQVNNLLVCWIAANPDKAGAFGLGGDALQLVIQQIAATNAASVYLALVERVSALIYHLFATCLVFMAVKNKKPILYFAAVAAHTVFNAGAGLLMILLQSYLNPVAAGAIAEAVLFAAILPAGLFVYAKRKSFDALPTVAQSSMKES